jgi:hypothetical protein
VNPGIRLGTIVKSARCAARQRRAAFPIALWRVGSPLANQQVPSGRPEKARKSGAFAPARGVTRHPRLGSCGETAGLRPETESIPLGTSAQRGAYALGAAWRHLAPPNATANLVPRDSVASRDRARRRCRRRSAGNARRWRWRCCSLGGLAAVLWRSVCFFAMKIQRVPGR